MSIAGNIQQIRSTLPDGVALVAVSKFHPAEAIEEAYAAGQRVFGESKAQELVAKYERLPKDIRWHFIGHLQTNKVKYIVPFIHLIESVDSLRLLEEIDRLAGRIDRKVPVLLQIHVARESEKFGFFPDECRQLLRSGALHSLPHVEVCGIMGMATFTDDKEEIREEFALLHSLFVEFKRDFFSGNDAFAQLSMGMSDDYPLAVAEGSTMVRVGSLIFGARTY